MQKEGPRLPRTSNLNKGQVAGSTQLFAAWTAAFMLQFAKPHTAKRTSNLKIWKHWERSGIHRQLSKLCVSPIPAIPDNVKCRTNNIQWIIFWTLHLHGWPASGCKTLSPFFYKHTLWLKLLSSGELEWYSTVTEWSGNAYPHPAFRLATSFRHRCCATWA